MLFGIFSMLEKTFGASILPSSLTLNVEPGTCEPSQREFGGKRDEIAWRE
jgi:hypothetical protein